MKSFKEIIVRENYRREMLRLLDQGNPEVAEDIDVVWCLSGRTSVLGKNHDGLIEKREKLSPTGYDDGYVDPTDDIERLRLAIRVAKKATNLKQRGVECKQDEHVQVIYNGISTENKDLEQFILACREVKDEGQLHKEYPEVHKYLSDNYKAKEEVKNIVDEFKEADGFIKIKYGTNATDIIEEMGDDIINTLTQVSSFNNFLKKAACPISKVACVSSAFHLPRVARSFSKQQEGNVFDGIRFVLHGIDLGCTRPGTRIDLLSEPNAIMNYIEGGKIAKEVSDTVDFPGKDRQEMRTWVDLAAIDNPKYGFTKTSQNNREI